MVYKDKFVAVVKSNGAILREKDGSVTLPFGSEYSLLLKNLDSRRAVVNVSIDGEDILNGDQIIIHGNSEFELEGFMRDSTVKNKFRFIHKTEKIVDHRGDKLDDGMIRVEYQFEKYQDESVTVYYNHVTHYHDDWWYDDRPYWHRRPYHPQFPYHPRIFCSSGFTIGSDTETSLCSSTGDMSAFSVSCNTNDTNSLMPEINQDEGITVAGSEANQQFTPSHIGNLEENSHVIILKLRGVTSQGTKITKSITVKTKLTCSSCGTKSKSGARFCCECSTALVI